MGQLPNFRHVNTEITMVSADRPNASHSGGGAASKRRGFAAGQYLSVELPGVN